MPSSEVEFRTIETPQGKLVVLWEHTIEERKLLVVLPKELAQAYIEALQDGREPDQEVQVVAEMGQTISPIPPAEAAQLLLVWTKTVLGE